MKANGMDIDFTFDTGAKVCFERKINWPTFWCPFCIALPKNSKIWVCFDVICLNKAVLRYNYSMPATDKNIASLEKSRMFSKLDANYR